MKTIFFLLILIITCYSQQDTTLLNDTIHYTVSGAFLKGVTKLYIDFKTTDSISRWQSVQIEVDNNEIAKLKGIVDTLQKNNADLTKSLETCLHLPKEVQIVEKTNWYFVAAAILIGGFSGFYLGRKLK